jgi:hypothetical protein
MSLFHSRIYLITIRFTDASVGYGAFATCEIKKDTEIDLIRGVIKAGTIEELLSKPFHFIFTGERKNGGLRKAIDASNQAALGKCLSAYANFAGPGTYYFHGGAITTGGHSLANIELVFGGGLDRMVVKTTSRIMPGDELFFPLGEYKPYLPTTVQQAAKLNIVHTNLPLYLYHRLVDIERMCNMQLMQYDFNRALEFLALLREKHKEKKVTEVLFRRYNIDLTVGEMLRYLFQLFLIHIITYVFNLLYFM